jgi:hypothetical protein
MEAEHKLKVMHATPENGKASYPKDGQVICWSDCPDEPNTWKVSEMVMDGCLYDTKTNVALPDYFMWFQIPRFVALYKIAEDAGL